MEIKNSVGRRKTAIARVHLKPAEGGKPEITINNRKFEEYFPLLIWQNIVLQPLEVTSLRGKFNFKVNLGGGGIKGQAEALRLAIARVLVKENEELKPILKKHGLMTRDSRVVERKKPGRPKARKRFQFSKR